MLESVSDKILKCNSYRIICIIELCRWFAIYPREQFTVLIRISDIHFDRIGRFVAVQFANRGTLLNLYMRHHRLRIWDFLFTFYIGIRNPYLKEIFGRIDFYIFECNRVVHPVNCINRLCLSLALNGHLLALTVSNGKRHNHIILCYVATHLFWGGNIVRYIRREWNRNLF